MPLTIQPSLVGNVEYPIVPICWVALFHDCEYVQTMLILNVQAKHDLVTLHRGLYESHIKRLEDGKRWHWTTTLS